MKLEFRPLTIQDQGSYEKILCKTGSRSCQYWFAGLFSLREKYGTEAVRSDSVLYIRQTRRRWNDCLAYFPPIAAGMCLGERGGYDCVLRTFLPAIFEDAAARRGRAYLFGITEEIAALVADALPENYLLAEDRDWFEYLYRASGICELSGSQYSGKRRDIRAFWRAYGERVQIEAVGRDNLGEVIRFQNWWQEEYAWKNGDPAALLAEHAAILEGLAHFKELGLQGILMRVDGRVAAYSYGALMGREWFDLMTQKSDYHYKNINKALFQEQIKRCGAETGVNYEEDLGLAGLRQAKLSYHPDALLKKYLALPREAVSRTKEENNVRSDRKKETC